MLAFVHVAKTAGRTVESMLRSAYGFRHCDTRALRRRSAEEKLSGRLFIEKYGPEDVRTMRRLSPGLRSLGGHQIALWSDVEAVCPDVQYLVFLRDPLKRGASHFQYQVQKEDMSAFFGSAEMTWDQWVDWEVHHNHQVKMLSPTVDPDDAIRRLEAPNVFVGLMERFDESLLLFKRLYRPDLNIAYRRKNTASDRSIAQEVLADPEKVERMRQMYALEFPVYEHVVNTIYPRYLERYGETLADDLAAYRAGGRDRVNRFNLAAYRLHRRYFLNPRLRRHLAGA